MSDVEYPLIRIDELTSEALPSRTHLIPVMKDGLAKYLTVGQILDLLIGTAPGVLDTIEELAAAFGNNPDAIANLTTLINAKLSKSGGAMTGDLDMASHLLSNPVLVSSLFADPTVGTKRLQLVLSGIASATTRSLTMPDRDVDLGRVPSPLVEYPPTYTGFGTVAVSDMFSCRVGDRLKLSGKFTVGTPTAVECRMSLGFNGVDGGLTIDATKVPTIRHCGSVTYGSIPAAASAPVVLMEGGVGYVTFGILSASFAGLAKRVGNVFASTGWEVSVEAEVPITGW